MRALKWPLIVLVVLGLLAAAYFAVVLNWSFSDGERAGWVQKLSRKGWVCKTWEGELSLISMPGGAQEKFYFTVWDFITNVTQVDEIQLGPGVVVPQAPAPAAPAPATPAPSTTTPAKP
jgi:hypothetical protein